MPSRIDSYSAPTEIIHGFDSLKLLGSKVKELGGKKAFFITDSGVKAAGVLDAAFASLEAEKVPFVIYDKAPQDPELPEVDKLGSMVNEQGCDCVIVAGGGSALCTGKAAALVATNGGSIRDYLGVEKYRKPMLLCIAIPTTAGSGSEVSKNTIMTDERSKRKVSVRGYTNAPRLAILDPMVLRTIPRNQAVSSGVDALTHAVEAYCSRIATPITDGLAFTAIDMIARNLCLSILRDDMEARSEMLLAASIANLACGNAGLGLVHGMNGAITYTYKARGFPPVEYGMIHAICLPHVLEFNLPTCEGKLASMAAAFGIEEYGSDAVVAGEVIERIKELLVCLDAPRKLAWEKVSEEVLEGMAGDVLANVAQHSVNPRKATKGELIGLFEKALQGWD